MSSQNSSLIRRWTLHVAVEANATSREEALARIQKALKAYTVDPDQPVQSAGSVLGLTCDGYLHPDDHVRECAPPPDNTILVGRQLQMGSAQNIVDCWLAVPTDVNQKDCLEDIFVVSEMPVRTVRVGPDVIYTEGVVEDEADFIDDQQHFNGHPETLPPGSGVPKGAWVWNNEAEEWLLL